MINKGEVNIQFGIVASLFLFIFLEFDRNTAIKNATDKGFEHGMEKEIEQGIEQGKIAQKRESAIKMLRKGSSIKDIMEITGFKKAEIEEIKKIYNIETIC